MENITEKLVEETKNTIPFMGEDDGSLAFLGIPRDKNDKNFNCKQVSQRDIVNTQFWVIDFQDEVSTKYSKGDNDKCVVFIKEKLSDSDSNGKKFFTGSPKIKYVLEEIRKRDAFPRKVTLKAAGNLFYFE